MVSEILRAKNSSCLFTFESKDIRNDTTSTFGLRRVKFCPADGMKILFFFFKWTNVTVKFKAKKSRFQQCFGKNRDGSMAGIFKYEG